ncbi:SGNH/GDSL hydrolase family protein [Lactococcus nasutitermitis]|uniref:SGNH/GDSL hydrolase family protein n=1 Tax=Lactococcus nasutitermitis TaxID=1652957 RepID=A0ABV9JJ08_9LACT|nr:SGNH/GDSL hydrolase family protein [Lactococcus nasutitermitis]
MKKRLLELAGFVLAILLIFGILLLVFPAAKSEFRGQKATQKTEKTLNYAALGDSLTEGVGDATGEGGFVPLFAKQLDNSYNVTVDYENFGKAGDTSAQIYARMTSQKKIEAGLKKADVITITVGGNDVLKVIRENISKISTLNAKDFTQPAKAYQKRVRKIFSTIRKENPNAQIYVVGIYNPFYLNFPNIKVMQTVIDNWNTATKSVVASEKNAYFVPINDLLYKGLDGKQAIEESSSSTTSESSTDTVQNDLLYTGDHFHPNNIGYQIMASAVFASYKKEN